MDWQKTFQTIKQHAFPRKAALERELSAAQGENQALSAELESVRNELQSTLNKDAQQITDLRQQLSSIQFEHSAARHQVQLLEASLDQASQRQASTEQQLSSLEISLEQERSQARQLEESLQQALRRQASTEQQLMTLDGKLEQERQQHESSLGMTRETLALLQSEQQNLLSLQTDQAKVFNEVGRQLLEAMQAATARPPRPVFQMAAVAGLLFLCGTLVGAVTLRGFQEGRGELAELNLGIQGMRVSMEQLFHNQNEILTGLLEALNRETAQASVPDAGSMEEEAIKQVPVPEPAATRVVRKPVKRTAYDNWGPLLLMDDTQAAGAANKLVFDPEVKEQQTNLMALGFNLGQLDADGLKDPQTERALEEFKLLYLPLAGMEEVPAADQLTPVIKRFADQAREDQKTYHIDSGVLAAIRLGSLHTDVDFSFLMELAEVESSFDPASRAQTTSAAGLYQFKDDTWLEAVREYGDKYGIGLYASQVEEVVNSKGKTQPVIHDSAVYQHVLDLRHNPRIAALLAAEYVKRNMQRLLYSLDREPGRTELYLTHFLGASGAISFLKALNEDPDKIARDIFPGAARRNQSIFRNRDSKPRTLAEVYKIFSRKFNTSRYEEG
ncbi:MAG: hypothetical protein OEN52_00225 [Gammaproteobacteria bacterium]|nr:hypothetical protein [Gammaproteobacteria bacterium]MDH3559367.1 hypothetical protein [Gammaproteobacteria bacterium]